MSDLFAAAPHAAAAEQAAKPIQPGLACHPERRSKALSLAYSRTGLPAVAGTLVYPEFRRVSAFFAVGFRTARFP